MRLIDADELKKELAKNITIWTFNVSYDGILAEIIDNAPTVDIPCNDCCADTYRDGYEKGKADARPQGEWLTFSTNHSIIQCSECTALLNNLRADIFKDKIGKMNFCPNCGAKMRGEEP